jgi:hypothetical protein
MLVVLAKNIKAKEAKHITSMKTIHFSPLNLNLLAQNESES